MVRAICNHDGYSDKTGIFYEAHKSYEIDETNPWNWRHFIMPAGVEMSGPVRDALKLSKNEADEDARAREQGDTVPPKPRKARAAKA
jgi:hypothetical protein